MKRKIISLKPWVFWLIYTSVIAVTILIDQLTKHFIEIAVMTHGRIKIIGDWLTLTWTTNDGATGGIFQKFEGRHILFFVMTLIGLPIFGFMLWRSRTRSVWGQVAFAFMVGGTIGNAIDRLFLVEKGGAFFSGAVRDFVQVQNFFGIFNMADSFLVVGVILALLAIVVFDYDSLVMSIISERKSGDKLQTERIVQSEGQSSNDAKGDEKTISAEKNDEDN